MHGKRVLTFKALGAKVDRYDDRTKNLTHSWKMVSLDETYAEQATN